MYFMISMFKVQHCLKKNNKSAKRKSTYTDRYRYIQPGGVKH